MATNKLYVDDYGVPGVTGNGSGAIIQTVTNPITGTNFTAGSAATYWPLLKKQWSTHLIDFTNVLPPAQGVSPTGFGGTNTAPPCGYLPGTITIATAVLAPAPAYSEFFSWNKTLNLIRVEYVAPGGAFTGPAALNGAYAIYTTNGRHGLKIGSVVTTSNISQSSFNRTNATVVDIFSDTTFVLSWGATSAPSSSVIVGTPQNTIGTVSGCGTFFGGFDTSAPVADFPFGKYVNSLANQFSNAVNGAAFSSPNYIDSFQTSCNATDNQCTLYVKSKGTLTVTLSTTSPAWYSGSPSITTSYTWGDSLIDVTKDTVDWAAAQTAFLKISTNSSPGPNFPNLVNPSVIEFSAGKTYIFERGVQISSELTGGNNVYKKLTVNGNNCTITATKPFPVDPSMSPFTNKLFYKFVPSERYAILFTLSNLAAIEFNDMRIVMPLTGRDTNPATQMVGILFPATYKAIANNCTLIGGDIGIDFQFGLGGQVHNCKFVNQGFTGLSIRNGQFQNAATSNTQSNGTVVRNVHFRVKDTASPAALAQFSAIYCSGASDCYFENIVLSGTPISGGNKCAYGIWFDNFATVVKDFEIKNVRIEKDFEHYAIRLCNSEQFKVSNLQLLAPNFFSGLVHTSSQFTIDPNNPTQQAFSETSGYPSPTIENFAYTRSTGSPYFRNSKLDPVSTSNRMNVSWSFINVRTDSPSPENNPAKPTGTNPLPFGTTSDWADRNRTPPIWDVATKTEPFYDSYYLSPSYNTIYNVTTYGSVVQEGGSSQTFRVLPALPANINYWFPLIASSPSNYAFL